MSISKQQKDFYNSFAQHGVGDAQVRISEKDVVLLIHIASLDLRISSSGWMKAEYVDLTKKGFFEITPQDIDALPEVNMDYAINCLTEAGVTDTSNVIHLYLKNLCELYRRRYKFANILQRQPFPLVEQIGPKCLIEYGNCESGLLFTWMNWRKWIYDIDNRSTQETGYLFEPIIASCLGGIAVSHRYSPVKRISESGVPTFEGRQIDCYISETAEAYELKLRVTIAASGQGRFAEELSFPYEAQAAGIKPVLIVFDPTPSELLDKLKKRYTDCGGRFAIGDSAWEELFSKAGNEMSIFIKKYIQPPMKRMDVQLDKIPKPISLKADKDHVIISAEDGHEYRIRRSLINE
jgi:hypothetical protein